jgi:hypothetical protein
LRCIQTCFMQRLRHTGKRAVAIGLRRRHVVRIRALAPAAQLNRAGRAAQNKQRTRLAQMNAAAIGGKRQ